MKKYGILLLSFCSILFLIACSSSGGGGGDDGPIGGNDDPDPIPAPSSANLVFPEDETECNTGVVSPNNENLSTVTFEWDASQNTDSYTVTVTNLNTGSSTSANATNTEADITIERGVPFEWFVTSRAQGTTETALSATFRFYNEGAGIENYAPFPAEAIAPQRGANIAAASTVSLEWSASDVDNDIASFEVFFGTDENNLISLGTVTEPSLSDVAITSGNTYFWQITTTDEAQNTSNSEIFQFRVN